MAKKSGAGLLSGLSNKSNKAENTGVSLPKASVNADTTRKETAPTPPSLGPRALG